MAAIAGEDVPVIDEVAKTEEVKPDFLRRQIASGRVAVMQRDGKPSLGIGEGLKTKKNINANIGTSAEVFDPDNEVEKARIAEKYGADTITDLSMGGNIDEGSRKENLRGDDSAFNDRANIPNSCRGRLI